MALRLATIHIPGSLISRAPVSPILWPEEALDTRWAVDLVFFEERGHLSFAPKLINSVFDVVFDMVRKFIESTFDWFLAFQIERLSDPVDGVVFEVFE